MKTGKVKFFNNEKKFGFIIDENAQPGSKDIFVHGSSLNGLTLRENDKVSFDTEDTAKGVSAINVELING